MARRSEQSRDARLNETRSGSGPAGRYGDLAGAYPPGRVGKGRWVASSRGVAVVRQRVLSRVEAKRGVDEASDGVGRSLRT